MLGGNYYRRTHSIWGINTTIFYKKELRKTKKFVYYKRLFLSILKCEIKIKEKDTKGEVSND